MSGRFSISVYSNPIIRENLSLIETAAGTQLYYHIVDNMRIATEIIRRVDADRGPKTKKRLPDIRWREKSVTWEEVLLAGHQPKAMEKDESAEALKSFMLRRVSLQTRRTFNRLLNTFVGASYRRCLENERKLRLSLLV